MREATRPAVHCDASSYHRLAMGFAFRLVRLMTKTTNVSRSISSSASSRGRPGVFPSNTETSSEKDYFPLPPLWHMLLNVGSPHPAAQKH